MGGDQNLDGHCDLRSQLTSVNAVHTTFIQLWFCYVSVSPTSLLETELKFAGSIQYSYTSWVSVASDGFFFCLFFFKWGQNNGQFYIC